MEANFTSERFFTIHSKSFFHGFIITKNPQFVEDLGSSTETDGYWMCPHKEEQGKTHLLQYKTKDPSRMSFLR